MKKRKQVPLRSDIAWSTPDRIGVFGYDLPHELIGRVNLGDMGFLEIAGPTAEQGGIERVQRAAGHAGGAWRHAVGDRDTHDVCRRAGIDAGGGGGGAARARHGVRRHDRRRGADAVGGAARSATPRSRCRRWPRGSWPSIGSRDAAFRGSAIRSTSRSIRGCHGCSRWRAPMASAGRTSG